MFQDWKHILLLKTGYTGAYERTECLRYSTLVWQGLTLAALKYAYINHGE